MKGEIQYLKFENEKLHSELVRKDTVIFEVLLVSFDCSVNFSSFFKT